MNKRLKFILLILGIGLLGFGLYTLLNTEANFRLGTLNLKMQSAINSYITIGLGLASIYISFLHPKSAIKPKL